MSVKTVKMAISACLLGDKVRYDGKHKSHEPIINFLSDNQLPSIKWMPFCPEVGIGLSVPRDKILLEQGAEQIHVFGVLNHTCDVTDALKSYAVNFMQQHPDVECYIVKSKSPSCGYQSTPLFQRIKGKNQLLGFSSGMFTRTISAMKPQLKIVE